MELAPYNIGKAVGMLLPAPALQLQVPVVDALAALHPARTAPLNFPAPPPTARED